MDLILKLNSSSLDSEQQIRPVLAFLVSLEGFEPSGYDLNGMENWRGWDLDRAVVDALTQRTQLFRVRGAKGGLMMLALGKHGESPTSVIQWEGDVEIQTLFESLDELAEVRMITDRWREALAGMGMTVELPMKIAWRGEGPAWATSFGLQKQEGSSVMDLRDLEPRRLAELTQHLSSS